MWARNGIIADASAFHILTFYKKPDRTDVEAEVQRAAGGAAAAATKNGASKQAETGSEKSSTSQRNTALPSGGDGWDMN